MVGARYVEGTDVWAWVPYEDDLSRGKDRPVLVVGRLSDSTVLGLPLSSQDHRRDHGGWMEIGTGPWDGWQRCSYVRLDRVRSIPVHEIRRVGGFLPQDRFGSILIELDHRGWPGVNIPERRAQRVRYEPLSPTPPPPLLPRLRTFTARLSWFTGVWAAIVLGAVGAAAVLGASGPRLSVVVPAIMFAVVGFATVPAARLAVSRAIQRPHRQSQWMSIWNIMIVASFVLDAIALMAMSIGLTTTH